MISETSRLAYREIRESLIRESLPARRRKVYAAWRLFHMLQPDLPYPTAGELGAFMGKEGSGSWKRLSELADKHQLLRRGDERICTATGHKAVEWLPPKVPVRQKEFFEEGER